MESLADCLGVFDDGSGPALYVGGRFLTASGVTVNNIAKWDGASWGPLGMGLGYPAAKAIARIAGRIDDDQVQRLLASENIWLRAGALAGLTEARAPGIEQLLEAVLQEHPPGVVYDHARVGLAQLRGTLLVGGQDE